MNNDNLPWFLLHPLPEQIYLTGSYLVLDFETDNLDYGSAVTEANDLAMGSWSIYKLGQPTVRKYKFGGIYDFADLLDDIASVDFIVCQNLKFELQWLKRCGLDLRSVLGYDTMLAAWVLDGNRRRDRDLNSLARRYGIKGKLDIVSQLIKLGVNVRDIHPGWVLEYCDQDVNITHQVFLRQREQLTAAKQWHLVHVRNMTASVLADLEFEGLTLDDGMVRAEHAKAVDIVEDLGTQLAAITGGINLGSPKQLAVYLYETLGFDEIKDRKGKPLRTKGGARATAADVLAKLVAKTGAQSEFLALYKQYNKESSMLSKNLDFFKLVLDQRNGKFFGSIRQGVVPTGRLSSSGVPILFDGEKATKSVQLQNIPRQFKKFFWSGDDDWLIMEADSGQLEFRVAVEMGNDPVGRHEIETGVDVHQNTADVITNAGQPTDRQGAKSISFAPLYGGGGKTKPEQDYAEYFKEHYAGISATQRGWAMKCLDQKQFTTVYGMTFYFPTTTMSRSGYISNSTSIYNYPVQGYATGEIIPIALVYFWHRTAGKDIRMFVTVHDSIISRVHKDSVEEANAIAQQALTLDVYEFLSRVYKQDFSIPLGLGIKVARNWGYTEDEIKMDVWPDGRTADRTKKKE